MDRLRDMDVNDQGCEQVEITMLSQVYPKETTQRSVQESHPWSEKERRVQQSTALTLVVFVITMVLGSWLLATPQHLPGAFFGRYRLMTIDGTVFNTPET